MQNQCITQKKYSLKFCALFDKKNQKYGSPLKVQIVTLHYLIYVITVNLEGP